MARPLYTEGQTLYIGNPFTGLVTKVRFVAPRTRNGHITDDIKVWLVERYKTSDSIHVKNQFWYFAAHWAFETRVDAEAWLTFEALRGKNRGSKLSLEEYSRTVYLPAEFFIYK